MNSNIEFLILSDENFIHIAEYNLEKIKQTHPESKITLYDWGITRKSLKNIQIKFPEVKVIDWKPQIHERTKTLNRDKKQKESILSYLRKTDYYSPDNYSKIREITDFLLKKNGSIRKRLAFENLLIEKLNCLREFVMSNHNVNLVWLDADAFPIKELNEVFDFDFDIGFTLRKENELDFRKFNCQAINVGVVFFKNVNADTKKFVDMWIDEYDETLEYCREQTAVTRFLQRETNIFDVHTKTASCISNDVAFKFKLFPCLKYNFNWIEQLIEDPGQAKNVSILHFKSSRHLKKNFEKLIKKIDV